MKLHQNLLWGAAASVLFTGCIDNNYDLSDIDTTSEFKVKDLVLPLNLDPVLLSDIIHVKEGDQIKEVTVGNKTFYAVEQSGEFYSDDITINSFEAFPSPMEQKSADFSNAGNSGNSGSVEFELVRSVDNEMEYDANDIDGSIRGLDEIEFAPTDFTIDLATNELPSGVESEMQDLTITFPKGLAVSEIKAGGRNFPINSYNPNTGELSLEAVPLIDSKAEITIKANAINLSHYADHFTYDETAGKGSLRVKSLFNVEKGRLSVSGQPGEVAKIRNLSFNVGYGLDKLETSSVVGSLEYEFDGSGLVIEPIDLSDVPSFLNDPETNLILSNPQVYLKLYNPVGKYGLSYQSSLSVLAQREDEDVIFKSPLVRVPERSGDFNFLLSPESGLVNDIPESFARDIERLDFDRLGYILSSDNNGLPRMLDIRIVNPMIPEQEVTSPFDLSKDIQGMKGEYMFLAPLALNKDSKIVNVVDGWWSEDLEDLTVNELTVTALADSSVPMDVILDVYPIDRFGNRIETSTDSAVKLPANSHNQEIKLTMAGNITDLDGLQIYVMSGSDNAQPLAPSQVITLNNIKAKVTGNYTKKF